MIIDFSDQNNNKASSVYDFKKIKNAACPKIVVNIFKDRCFSDKSISTTCLLDSGASFSAISAYVYESCERKLKLQRTQSSRGEPSQADNSKLICHGETIVHILIRDNNGMAIKLLNVRLTIIQNLSYNIILGMDILKKMNFQVIDNKNAVSLSGRQFNTEEITTLNSHSISFDQSEVMKVTQLSIQRRAWTPSDTATLYRVSHVSRNTFDYFCRVNRLSTELESAFVINMFHESVKSGKGRNLAPSIKAYPGKIIWSGPLQLTALNNRIKKEERKLIKEDFYEELVKKSKFKPEMKKELGKLLLSYRHIFSRDETDIGLYLDEEVSVRLRDPNIHPPYMRARPIPHAAKEYVKEKVHELTKNGIFEEVKKGSAYNSPCHIVMTKKDDGSTKFRLCVDYSQLNKYLIPDCYPIPRIRDIINSLEGKQFFSSIDLRSGFWNLKLKKECRDLLSFSVGQKQLRPVRMPMGLCTSPSIFQRVMRTILRPFLDDFVHVYIDDAIIMSENEEAHIKHIKKVLEAFEKSGILLNAEKCIFAVQELSYLGFKISNKGWTILPKRKKEIENFNPPRNQREVKKFIGIVGFLTPCCERLQYLLDPLHKISGSKSKFKWTEVEQNAFDEIKQVILKSAMMAYPKSDPSFTMFLSTDSSDIGWGAVLSQLNEQGIEKPLGFCSGAWKNSEVRWDIRNKEFHALVNALDYFYEFLFARNFVWRCDNQALSFLKNSLSGKSLRRNQRILRALDFVNMFNFSFELKKGESKEMAIPDYLSRVLPENSVTCLSELNKIDLTNFWSRSECSLDEFIQLQKEDPDLKSIGNFQKSKRWKFLIDRGLKMFYSQTTGLAKGIMNDKEKILVPVNYEQIIIQFWHLPIHRSPNEIHKKLEDYLFPKMQTKISEFVKNCPTCCAVKPDKSFKASMSKTSTPKHPWSDIMIDLLGPYSQTMKGYKYIMVVICQLTGFTVLKCLKNKTAIETTEKLNEIFNQYGLPLGISSDNGREFKNDTMETYLMKLKISHKFSTPYRPRTNGQVERANQEILKMQKLLKSSDMDWDEDVQLIAFLINNSFNRNIGLSPFEAFHGWAPIVPSLGTFPQSKNSDLRNIDFNLATRIMKHRIVLNDIFARRESIKVKNQIPEESPLSIGSHVLFKSERPVGSSKLFNPWFGQFVVKARIDNDSYLISPTDDPRKQYIAYRGRLRRIGPSSDAVTKTDPPKAEETEDVKSQATKQETEEHEDHRGVRFGLRPRKNTDYRKFY